MPTSTDEKDNIQLLYFEKLFLPVIDGDDPLAPVVILQNDAANIYSVLEAHFAPSYLPQPDRFWKNVRTLGSVQYDTWRPRVYGSQLKMLQHARLPCTAEEWAALGEALSSVGSYLQPSTNPEMLLRDLQSFTRTVEQWWAGRKRDTGAGVKRAAAPGYTLQPPMKRINTSETPFLVQPGQDLMLAGGNVPLDPGAAATFSMDPLAAANGLGLQVNPGFEPSYKGHNPMTTLPALDTVMPPRVQSCPAGGPGAHPKVIALNVGGHEFKTTLPTLGVVDGSYFWKLAQRARTAGVNEFFVDRSGEFFSVILEYLRCMRYNEDPSVILPSNCRALQNLKREAAWYRLPGLVQAVETVLAGSEGK